MFMIAMPSGFNVGDTHDCRVDGEPARLTWRDADTLVIEPDDARRIVHCERDEDGNIHFICADADGAAPVIIDCRDI